MPVEYDVTRTGNPATKHYDVTVVFHTTRLDVNDVHDLGDEAKPFLEDSKVIGDVKRHIRLFVRRPRTVAILH